MSTITPLDRLAMSIDLLLANASNEGEQTREVMNKDCIELLAAFMAYTRSLGQGLGSRSTIACTGGCGASLVFDGINFGPWTCDKCKNPQDYCAHCKAKLEVMVTRVGRFCSPHCESKGVLDE